MTVATFPTKRSGCYLGESAALNIINEEIIILSGSGVLDAGTVLGKARTGTPTVVASAAVSGSGGTPGNGAIGTVTADSGAPEGDYQIRILNPATNAGAFEVTRPDGTVDGLGAVGSAFNGMINFTLADGSTDFSEDDRITVRVSRSAPGTKYRPHDPANVDGSQVAAAILFHPVDATSADVKTVGTVNGPATINGNMLTYKSGISAGDLNAAQAALRAKHLKILPQHAV